jgi:uncharacterized protein
MKYKLVAFFLLVMSLQAHSASFDCTKAKTFIEKEICTNEALGGLDEKLADSYKNAISSSPNPSEITNEQRKWLREVRNICTDSNCLIKAYQVRIKDIHEVSQRQVSAKPAPTNEPIFELTPQELKNSIPKTSLAEFETKYLNDFKLFYKRFQYLVQNNKKEEISELIKFPINKKIKNKKLFLDNFDDIFDAEMRASIKNVEFAELYALKGEFNIGKYGYDLTFKSIGKSGAPYKFGIDSLSYKNNRDE